MVLTMRAPSRSGAELGSGVEVRERLPLGHGQPEERAERLPALADLSHQEAIRGYVPAQLLIVPVEDVDGEGPILEPAPEHPFPEPVDHPSEDTHRGSTRRPIRERVVGEVDRLANAVIPAPGSRTVRMTFAPGYFSRAR